MVSECQAICSLTPPQGATKRGVCLAQAARRSTVDAANWWRLANHRQLPPMASLQELVFSSLASSRQRPTTRRNRISPARLRFAKHAVRLRSAVCAQVPLLSSATDACVLRRQTEPLCRQGLRQLQMAGGLSHLPTARRGREAEDGWTPCATVEAGQRRTAATICGQVHVRQRISL